MGNVKKIQIQEMIVKLHGMKELCHLYLANSTDEEEKQKYFDIMRLLKEAQEILKSIK